MLIYFDFVASFAIGVQKAGILKRKVMKKESFSMNRTVRKNSLLFLAGSGLYPLLEVLWRGYSHASMALAGGVCLLLINAVCCEKMKRRSLPARCAIGSLIITVVEFLFGLLVNRVLHLHVWDYSALPLNIMGQICLPFSLIWFVLTIPASALCKLCWLHQTKAGNTGGFDNDVGRSWWLPVVEDPVNPKLACVIPRTGRRTDLKPPVNHVNDRVARCC